MKISTVPLLVPTTFLRYIWSTVETEKGGREEIRNKKGEGEKTCTRAHVYASRRAQEAIVLVMNVAPTKIPRTGTSGYRNAKLETHHQQKFASCRSLPTPSAGGPVPIVCPFHWEHRQALAPTVDPNKRGHVFQPHNV